MFGTFGVLAAVVYTVICVGIGWLLGGPGMSTRGPIKANSAALGDGGCCTRFSERPWSVVGCDDRRVPGFCRRGGVGRPRLTRSSGKCSTSIWIFPVVGEVDDFDQLGDGAPKR